jgi:hypothetical protein
MARLKRRGSIWYAWIPKPEGGTRLKSTNCTDKEAARQRAKELERSAVDPAHSAANAASFADACAAFLASRRARKRAEGTLHHYGVKLRQLMRLLPARLAEHTHAEGEKYIATRVEEGAEQTTVKKELRAWGAVLKLAHKNDTLLASPSKIIPELEDTYVPGTRTLTPWEMVGLAMVLPGRRMAIIAFSVATGAEKRGYERARRIDVAADFSLVRLRGTKRRSRDRMVPIPPGARRTLLEWAVVHADGVDLLFAPWSNVNRDVADACEKLGIPSCSPNDWRRTFGTWLRQGGVEPQLIGAAMGHMDSRMAERVYAKLGPEELARLLESRLLAGPESSSVSPEAVRLMSGDPVDSVLSDAAPDTAIHRENSQNVVPRDGIEPPTRGFSIPGYGSAKSGKEPHFANSCPVCVEQLPGVSPEKVTDELGSGGAGSPAMPRDFRRTISPDVRASDVAHALKDAVGSPDADPQTVAAELLRLGRLAGGDVPASARERAGVAKARGGAARVRRGGSR